MMPNASDPRVVLRPLERALAALQALSLADRAAADPGADPQPARFPPLAPDVARALVRVLDAAPTFGGVALRLAADAGLGERFLAIAGSFDSIRDDAAMMVRQAADGRIDTVERLANLWMKATRGDIPGRFARIRAAWGELARDAQDCLEREQIVLHAWRDFREALREAQALASDALAASIDGLSAAKVALQEAASVLDEGDASEAATSARDLRLRELQDEDRRHRRVRSLVETLAATGSSTDVALARMAQMIECKERLQAQASGFFGTHEAVLGALSASFTGLHRLGAGAPDAGGDAGGGLHVGVVERVVEAIGAFQARTRQEGEALRALATSAVAELRLASEDGQQRRAALVAAAGPAPSAP
jgi:hypothetical protein